MRVFMIVANEDGDEVRQALAKVERLGASLIEVPELNSAKVVGAVAEALVARRDAAKAAERPPSKPPEPVRKKSGTQPAVRKNGSGQHRVFHAWVPEGPNLDRCAKCGMLREQLPKGVLGFMDRNGVVVERQPFGDPTPACDARLVSKRLMGTGS